MKYNVTHITAYSYGQSIPQGHNLVHLKPRQTRRQRLLSHSISVKPKPTTRIERIDFFGNSVTSFSVHEPHSEMEIVARSTADVEPFDLPTGIPWNAWENVRQQLVESRQMEVLYARQFRYDSPHVATGPELADFGRTSFTPDRPLLECVTDLTTRIYHEFTFDTGVTTIGTPSLEVLQHRHGVCQDFAHVQIGCLRSLGLAARYVSGYLLTKPPPGQPRMVGADASHAWVSVFFPEFGWIDFDPTNGVIPSSEHVTLAWARDYSDISPVRGVVVGGRRHTLSVSVDVEPLSPLIPRDQQQNQNQTAG